MERRTKILSPSLDRETAHRREDLLKYHGYEVVSASSPAQARFEIEMGQCGVLVSGALVPDIVNADLFAFFKKYCPEELTIRVISNSTYKHSTPQPNADVEVMKRVGQRGFYRSFFPHTKNLGCRRCLG